jgi:CheY-like chemotaxis protein
MPSDSVGAGAPLVLLAEDDDTSRQFLAEALRQLGCRVEACADGGAALERATGRRFDLLLMDCRMPGAGASQVLERLRGDARAASHASVAIATSAEMGDGLREALRRSGFAAALAKPLSLQTLQSALAAVLPGLAPTAAGDPTLDVEAALRSSGNAETMQALRSLFDDELRRLMQDLDALARRPDELDERLHRLLASCGFCGAAALARQTESLKRRLAGSGADDDALDAFRNAVAATLQGLSSTTTPRAENPPAPL